MDKQRTPTVGDLRRAATRLLNYYNRTLHRLNYAYNLPPAELQDAAHTFKHQRDLYRQILENYRGKTRFSEGFDGLTLIDSFYYEQAGYNEKARFYQLPPFPLDPKYNNRHYQHTYRLKASDDRFFPLVWDGDELKLELLQPAKPPVDGWLVAICYRPAKIGPRLYVIGFAGGFTARKFILRRDHPRLAEPRPDLKIYQSQIVHYFRIKKVVHNWDDQQQEGGQAA